MISIAVAGALFVLCLVGMYGMISRPARSYDSASQQQARDVSASVDRLMRVGSTADLEAGLAALEGFVRAMDAFYNGRPFSPGDTELHATLLACITKLTERVSRPVVSP